MRDSVELSSALLGVSMFIGIYITNAVTAWVSAVMAFHLMFT